MTDTESTDSEQHFTKTVAELGEQQPVVASCAIFNENGVKIIEKGVSINLNLYERLMQHKLSAPIEDCVSSSNTVTGESLRLTAQGILDEIAFYKRLAPDNKTRALLLDAIETIPLPDPIAFQLTIARDVRPDVYLHLIRTALTAAWLAKTPLLSRFDVNMAAASGLLHDIGMLHIDPLLLQPQHLVSHHQQRQLYAHPLVSTALIERHHRYPKEVVRAVREHHEYLDGSGYPRNLAGDAISPLGKLLSLSTVVAAMFAPGRAAPELRLSVLLRMNTHKYDGTLVLQVIASLQPRADVMTAGLEHFDDPVSLLLKINGVLGQWPAELAAIPKLSPARRDELALMVTQIAQIERMLAGVGVAPDQLAQLGSEALDDELLLELTLLTREAGWQVRTLARQIRHRWRAKPGEHYPAPLQAWLDKVDTVVAAIPGAEAHNDARDESVASHN
jgi:HD-GYP domain-containing protein (c-di-GMP phosphodiesterase class II)